MGNITIAKVDHHGLNLANTMDSAGCPPKIYALRKAGMLDLPPIYALMQEGSRNGVFNNFYITHRGQVAVFKFLLRDLFAFPAFFGGKYSNREFHIFMLDGADIGFVALQDIPASNGDGIERNIAECAIHEAFRNRHHGWHLINMVIDTVSDGTCLSAYCTPNAKAMQAILVKHQFTLEKTVEIPDILPLCYYTLTKKISEQPACQNSVPNLSSDSQTLRACVLA
jgi:RimJ/RimL family protein N-acetyltransferase